MHSKASRSRRASNRRANAPSSAFDDAGNSYIRGVLSACVRESTIRYSPDSRVCRFRWTFRPPLCIISTASPSSIRARCALDYSRRRRRRRCHCEKGRTGREDVRGGGSYKRRVLCSSNKTDDDDSGVAFVGDWHGRSCWWENRNELRCGMQGRRASWQGL